MTLSEERERLLLNHDEEVVNTLMEMTAEARRLMVTEVEGFLGFEVGEFTYPLEVA